MRAHIFLNGSYEIAILDSYGKEPDVRSNGAIYRKKAPDTNASKPAGEWQTMEVTFRNGKATVSLNGKQIHNEVALDTPTLNGFPKVTGYAKESWQKRAGIVSEGPLRLQAENSEVRFANVAIKRLK